MGDGPRPQAAPSVARSGAAFLLTLVAVIVVGALGGYALGLYVFDRLVTVPGPAGVAPAPVSPAAPAGQPAAPAGQPAAPTGQPAASGSAPEAPGEKPQPATATGPAFFVQVGAFGSAERAQGLADRLASQGLPVTVERLQSGQQTLYKVRVGPYSRREDAQKTLAQLKPSIPDAFIP